MRKSWSRRDFLKSAGAAAVATGGLGGGLTPAGFGVREARGQSIYAPPGRTQMSKDEIEALLAELVADLDRRGLYATALYEEGEDFTVRASREGVRVSPTPRWSGVVLQLFDGHLFREASTDRVERDALARLARELAAGARRPPPGVAPIDPGTPLVAERRTPCEIDPAHVPVGDWKRRTIELFERADTLDPRVRSANASTSTHRRFKIFVNRTRRLRQEVLRTTGGIFVFAMDGGATGGAWQRQRYTGGFENTDLGGSTFEAAARILDDDLRAERIEPGEYDIVSAPEITGLLAHESFGHGVEYDQIIKGRARAAHFLGKRVAPPMVQIHDDPSQRSANGSYFFDDEGLEARNTQIVRDGIFVQPLTDLFSSTEGDVDRTPNGRRQRYSHKAYARMSNTFFGTGTDRYEDMVASLDHGMILEGMQSGMEDPHGWGIQLSAHRAYEVKNGQKTGRVFSPVGVTGYVPEILDSISMVSDVFELTSGTCGKGHKEFVPVSDGGPHLKFRATLG